MKANSLYHLAVLATAFLILTSIGMIFSADASHALDFGVSASTQEQTRKEFTLLVDVRGFNGSSTLKITVNEGDLVVITFIYGDGGLKYDNPHRIYLQDYGIVSEIIGKEQPQTTIQFVANQVGEFRFYCDIPCIGMDHLQGGTLMVNPGLRATILTHLALNVTEELRPNGEVMIRAKVMDEGGLPVSGVVVKFLQDTTFGAMRIGAASTDASGTATIHYRFPAAGSFGITAAFVGGGRFQGNETTSIVTVFPKGIEEVSLPPWFGKNVAMSVTATRTPIWGAIAIAAVVGAIVGSVWATYFYIFSRIVRICLAPKRIQKDVRQAVTTHAENPVLLYIVLGALLLAVGLLDSILLGMLNLPIVSSLMVLVTLLTTEGVALALVLHRLQLSLVSKA